MMQEYVGKVCMNLDYYEGLDRYSDGPIEDKLLEITQHYTQGEYNSIIAQENSWPILYHLSNLRGNIIAGVEFDGTERVLEIGSGCGALTGTVADKAAKVTCIELSKKRSLINAYRNKDKENIEIMVGNFETIQEHLEEKYDVITLIGVFEYAQSYINDANPFKKFLSMMKGHLAEGGRIIIAIENKYGLKYWAGCREDHINTFFGGIEGYQNTNRARTFTKDVIENMLRDIGMERVDFYYPYPDYKFPTAIYSDAFLPKPGELVNNMRNFDNDRMYLFNEANAFNSLIEDGLFPLFSNSYLIISA